MFLKILSLPVILKHVNKRRAFYVLCFFLLVILIELIIVCYFTLRHFHQQCF